VLIDTWEQTAKAVKEASPSTERLYKQMPEANWRRLCGGGVGHGMGQAASNEVTSRFSDCHQLAKKEMETTVVAMCPAGTLPYPEK
jgi:hypothetical protein